MIEKSKSDLNIERDSIEYASYFFFRTSDEEEKEMQRRTDSPGGSRCGI